MTDNALPSAQPKPRRAWLPWLLLLVLLIAAASGGWLGWQALSASQQQQQQLAQQLTLLQSRQATLQQTLTNTEKQQSTQLASLQEQVLLHGQKLAQLGEGGTTLWLLNEAKTLASLAQQRLLLTADLPATAQLLAASDKVLARIDDASILPARRALAQDIQRVTAAQQLDTTALLLQLGALMTQLDDLTLPEASDQSDAATESSDAADTGWWQQLLARLPISIRRADGALPLPLAPAQLAQARLSLAMDLQQAQLALLQGRAEVYAQALRQADATLTGYFAADNVAVKSLKAALAKLQAVHINQALPQIGAGLEAIKSLLHQAAQSPAQGG